ncbi:DUF5977 domain-containing protein [Chitinophaga sp. Hz27]|uniref:DUF5977 domain-containing protein n=1 Tax=Chitinophaga sp. Hz27 TaxID=3347169 RepID=UPI0035DF8F21
MNKLIIEDFKKEVVSKSILYQSIMKFKQLFAITGYTVICTLFNLRVNGQSINDLEKLVPTSPKAEEMTEYGKISINGSKGLPNISIPIHEIKVDGVALPISISYNASGIKTGDLSSEVGLKWSLNVGANISRTVNYRPDETSEGILNANFMTDIVATDLTNNFLYGQQQSTLKAISDNGYDLQQDNYNYSLPGSTGAIFFDTNNKLLPTIKAPYTFGYTNGFTQFTINDKTGNSFLLEPTDQTYVHGYSTGSGSSSGRVIDGNANSAWRLKTLFTNNGKQVAFSYESYALQYTQLTGEYYIEKKAPGTSGDRTCDNCGCGTSIGPLTNYKDIRTTVGLVKEIITPSEIIRFTYSTDASLSIWQRELNSIQIISRESGSQIKKIDFVYGTYPGDNRLRLDKVIFKNATDTDQKVYSFAYASGLLPSINSKSRDIFDYLKMGSQLSLLSQTGGNVTFQNANREIDESPIGILNAIQYPTMGVTNFYYEPNSEVQNGIKYYAGGYRLKRIEDKDITGRLFNVKEYEYSGLIGNITSFPVYVKTKNNSNNSLCPVKYYGTENFPTNEARVKDFYYNKIRIKEKSVTGEEHTTDSYTDCSLHNDTYYPTNTRTTIYKTIAPGQYEVVQSTASNSNVYETGNIRGIYQLNETKTECITDLSVNPVLIGFCDSWIRGVDAHDSWSQIGIETASTTEELRSGTKILTNLVTYENDRADHLQPIVIHQIINNGQERTTRRRYINDYQQLQGLSQEALQGINLFKSNGNTGFLLEEELSQNGTLINKARYNYQFFSVPGKVLTASILDWDLVKNQFYPRVTVNSYSANGTPQDFTGRDGIPHAYLWSPYNSLEASALNAMTSQIAHAGFEGTSQGGWVYDSIPSLDGLSGRRSLLKGTMAKSVPMGNYVVALWAKGSGSVSVNGVNKSITSTWKYYEWSITQTNAITVSPNNNQIDEVNLFPSKAMMTSFTYDNRGNLIAINSPEGKIAHFEYDNFNRLSASLNNSKQYLGIFEEIVPGTISSIYFNKEYSKYLYRTNCSLVQQGVPLSYTIPAGKYSSTISQLAADDLAAADWEQNAREYANRNGVCPDAYYNKEVSKNFWKDCGPNILGSQVTYTVPANKFKSQVSQQDADLMAQNDISANGQNNANTLGICNPTTLSLSVGGLSNNNTVSFTIRSSSLNYTLTKTGLKSGQYTYQIPVATDYIITSNIIPGQNINWEFSAEDTAGQFESISGVAGDLPTATFQKKFGYNISLKISQY